MITITRPRNRSTAETRTRVTRACYGIAAVACARGDPMKMTRVLLVAVVCAPAALVARQQAITFTPTAGVPTYAVREPVLRIQPGTIVETKTFSKPGDYYEGQGGAWPGEVGPFHIE